MVILQALGTSRQQDARSYKGMVERPGLPVVVGRRGHRFAHAAYRPLGGLSARVMKSGRAYSCLCSHLAHGRSQGPASSPT